MKKGLSLFLSLIIVLGVLTSLPIIVSAFSSGTCGTNVTWTLDDDGVLTISGMGNMRNYLYSSSAPWYSSSSSINSVVICSGVTSIGDASFEGCTNLTSITIPDSVTSIGSSAFYNTAYYNDSANWENGVLYIGNYLIKAKTSLNGAYEIKDGTKTIAESAFIGCRSLTSITIPDSITNLGNDAFVDCFNLTEVYITDLEKWCNINFGKGASNPLPDNEGGSKGSKLYINGELATSITIPAGVTKIRDSTFNGCTSLTSVTIPDSVTNIDSYAFSYCTSLESITIPENVESIGNGAFYNCTNLTSVYIADVASWCGIGFNNESSNPLYYANKLYLNGELVNKLIIPDGVKSINEYSFRNCAYIKSVIISESVTEIKDGAFSDCVRLNSITIPENVTSIGESVFLNCNNLKNVFYGGKEENLSIKTKNNGCVFAATWHYESTDHIPSSWITDKKATVYSAGSKHKKCTECGEVLETATIKQLKCSKPKLSKISNTSSGVKITWGKVSGADSYEVYRKVKDGSYSKIGTTSKTYFTDKKAKSGKKYYYIVKAVNEAGKSASSSSKSILYLADPTLKTAKSTKSGVSLKWTKTTGAQGYVIYRKTGSGSYKKLKTEKGVSNLSYVDKSAKKGKKYTYKVKAYYSKTYSAYSNTKTIKDKY